MNKSVKFFHCNRCEKGLVKMTIKVTRQSTSFRFSRCDGCEYQYGIKGASTLKEFKPEKVS